MVSQQPIMAQEYPKSQFFEFDNHLPPIEAATENAKNEKVDKNIKFSQVSANESIGNDYDLVTFFDCLRDMGDPLGALKFAKQSLKMNGSCMIVEPMANDKIEDNLNMVGRIYYAASSIFVFLIPLQIKELPLEHRQVRIGSEIWLSRQGLQNSDVLLKHLLISSMNQNRFGFKPYRI